MQFLATTQDIFAAILRCQRDYRRWSWAIAWASTRFPAWDHLLKNRKRIHRLVIGTHFYQTHPDVLDELANEARVHFVLRPDGVFHPKLYLFENGPNGWACVCGSANFTRGASADNLEAAVLIDGRDASANLHKTIR